MARNAGKIYDTLSNQEMLLVWIHIHVFSESSAGQTYDDKLSISLQTKAAHYSPLF